MPTTTEQLPNDAVEVGTIGGAFGIHAWFKVYSHSPDADALQATHTWFLKHPQTQQITAIEVEDFRLQGTHWIARSKAIPTREAVRDWQGCQIFVSRSDFPKLCEKETYYWVDLIGLAVINRQGEHLGCVKNLMHNNVQAILVVDADAETNEPGAKPTSYLIPFVSHFVDKVELDKKQIQVDWQKDYAE